MAREAWLSDVRGAADFRQPVLTFAENQMIRAEAQYRTSAQPAALATLNAYRASVGLAAKAGLTGAALLAGDHGRKVRRAVPEHRGVERLSSHLLSEPNAGRGQLHPRAPGIRDGRASRQPQHSFAVAAAEAESARPRDGKLD